MAANDENSTRLYADDKQEKDDLPSQRFDDGQSQAPNAEAAPNLEAQIKQLQEELEKTKQALVQTNEKAQKNWDMVLRKEAELQNVQRRAQTQAENAKKFALERFSAELLQVVDSLEQGLTHCSNDNVTIKDVLDGMVLTHKVVLEVMQKEGILQINPEDSAFDPNFHEAISIIETNDYPPNHVVSVIQRGYVLNERLLRPARVVVSRATTTES